MRALSLPLLLLLTGCGAAWSPDDGDGDGIAISEGDCWDRLEGPEGTGLSGDQIHPGAIESWYDGFDQDCAGDDDFDKDGDGFRAAGTTGPDGVAGDDCWDDPDSVPADYVAVQGRAQPSAAEVFPGAVDAFYDDVDQDCAGDGDFDADGDGYASSTWPDRDGNVGDDCLDAVDDDYPADVTCTGNGDTLAPEDVHPGADDVVYDGTDADCAGDADFDADADGHASCLECDDADPTRFPDPSVEEIWYNLEDENCDGNDGDQDGDGFYVAGYPDQVPPDYASGDCWDNPNEVPSGFDAQNGFPALAATEVHPGADDASYDAVDADCAGDDDFDADLDGYATDAYADRTGAWGDDCDDADANVAPGAVDVWYDGEDSDCAGDDDFDQDGDGQRSADHGSGAGYTDCDDSDDGVYLGASETCDGVDADCDGSTNDEGATGCSTFFADVDADGYGASGDDACLCTAAAPYTATVATDCNDASATVNPGQTEKCSTTGVDDDCDGATDEVGASGCASWYLDADNDGYGSTTSQCACAASGSYDVASSTDCDDTRSSVHPGAAESCNDRDDDCDSSTDEGLTLYYADADDDGYGDATDAGDCANSATGVASNTDCDDSSAMVNPGASEVCDGEDNDCDGTTTDENGVVSLETTAGVWSDQTTAWTGTSSTSIIVDLPSSGTVHVCDGTWYVRLRTQSGNDSTATIVSQNGAASTTIDPSAIGAAMSIAAGHVTVEGFTITNGIGSSVSGGRGGGAAILNFTSAQTTPNLTLKDCVVTGNDVTADGGALYLTNYSYVALIGTKIYGNTASDDGGAVYLEKGKLTCADSSSNGGGVYDNIAGDDGGGVFVNHATGSVVSTGCDWGTSAAGDDNDPDDVNLGGSTSYASYGTAATFTCTGTACAP